MRALNKFVTDTDTEEPVQFSPVHSRQTKLDDTCDVNQLLLRDAIA